jgi:hypothetical protein
MVKLFHKEVFWPNLVLGQLARYQNKTISLSFSRHALQECMRDRYAADYIIPPAKIIFDSNTCFETELTNNLLSKLAIRIKYNPYFDLTMVLIPDDNRAMVKTVWLNDLRDTHKTLNASQYCSKI